MRKLVLGITCLLLVFGVHLHAGGAQETTTGPVELTFFYPVLVPGPVTELLDELIADFTSEHPEVQITPVYSGSYDQTIDRIQTLLRGGGELPHIAIIGNQHTAMYVNLDLIEPLDDFIAGEGASFAQDLVPGFMTNPEFRGQTWSIPFQRSTPVMFYNKDMFREAGLDPEQPPRDWTEVMEYADRLTKRDAAGNAEVWGVQIPSDIDAWVVQALAVGNGRPWSDETAANKVYFDHPATLDVIEHLLSLADEGVMPDGLVPWAETPATFTSERAAMIYHSIGSNTAILNQTRGVFDMGVAFIPGGPQGPEFGVITGGGNLAVFQHASEREQEAAKDFIRFMTRPDTMARWASGTGYLPVTRSSFDHPTYQAYLSEAPGAGVAFRQLDYAAKQMGVHELLQVTDEIKAAIQASLTGQADPASAISAAQQRIDTILERFPD